MMRIALLPLVVVIGLSGCQWFDREKPGAPSPAPTGSLGESVDLTTPVAPATKPVAAEVNAALTTTPWTLAELDGQPAMVVQGSPPASITFNAENQRFAGNTGVNRFGGSYTLGAGKSLKLVPGAMTRMAGPELLMRQESKLLDALRLTTSYTVEGDTLTLLAGDRVVARFMRIDEAAR